MARPRLIFLGPPGTGKGTQAARMATRYNLTACSSGDALREEIRERSDIGRQVNEYVESGNLVPDELITDVMLAAIDKFPTDCGFILDGFPRTVHQAESLSAGLDRRGLKLDGAMYFRLDHQTIIERITSRRICVNCNRTYNLRFMPPAVPGRCDSCDGKLMQRVDDREDVIATRLATYEELTVPLVEYYTDGGLVHQIDADATPEEVAVSVAAVIDKLLGS